MSGCLSRDDCRHHDVRPVVPRNEGATQPGGRLAAGRPEELEQQPPVYRLGGIGWLLGDRLVDGGALDVTDLVVPNLGEAGETANGSNVGDDRDIADFGPIRGAGGADKIGRRGPVSPRTKRPARYPSPTRPAYDRPGSPQQKR